MTIASRQRIGAFILLAFFLSGMTGLIYEILWVRLLTRYVGGSTFSVTVVLTVFMAGLGLGSWMAGRFVDRIQDSRDLVRLYAIIEIAIGLYAGLFPLILTAFVPLYALLYKVLGGSLIAFGLTAGVLTIVLLILPTTLMGATLPVLSRYYVDTVSRAGTRTGRLYGINTIGAALGSLACGVVLLRFLGSHLTLALAVTLNVLIGTAFLYFIGFRTSARTGFIKSTLSAMRSGSSTPRIRFSRRSVVVLLAVSGACSMAYEVIWTKLLALLVGPTTYSFTLVLFTFITGLALGSLLFGWICDRVKRPMILLVGTQLAAAGAALLCSQFLGNSQIFFAKLLDLCRHNLLLLEAVKGTMVFASMLPATLFLGAIFPIATRIETERVGDMGSIVGRLYMFNTVGAVIGSITAGFILVPLLGKATSLSLLAFVQIAFAVLAILIKAPDEPSPRRGVVIWGVALLCLSLAFPRWDTHRLTKGKYHRFDEFRDRLQNISFAETILKPGKLTEGVPDIDKMVYFADGIGGFISVAESVNSLGITNVFLQISGKTDASSHQDLHTMTLTGQVPMLLHPEAKRAMVVGLASGITAGEMLHYPLDRLDVLEISPEVVEACRFFDPWNNGILNDPRAHIILQDARTHITLTDRIYDVIVSEPSNPWMAGIANLFTKEYFEAVRDHLAPDGVFVQWYHAYQTDWDSFSLVGRTLTDVFPNNCIIRTSTTGSDYLMIAFRDQRPLSDYLARIPQAMPFAQRSSNMKMATPDVLLPLVAAENPRELYGSGPLHTEVRPLLEFASLREFYSGGTDILGHIVKGSRLSISVAESLRELSSPQRRLDFAEFMASMNVEPFGLSGLPADANTALTERWAAIIDDYSRKNRVAYDRIMTPSEKDRCIPVQEAAMTVRLTQATAERAGPHILASIHFDVASTYIARSDWEQAIVHLRQAALLLPDYRAALQNLALCNERAGDYGAAARVYEKLVLLAPESPMLWARLAATHLHLASDTQARRLFEQSLALSPSFAPALIAIGSMELESGNTAKAVDMLRQALTSDPRAIRAYQNIALALIKANEPREALRYVIQGLHVRPGDKLLLDLHSRLLPPPD